LINEAGENTKQSVIEVAEERFERRLAEELGKLRAEIAEEISKLRAEMHDLRASLIQWMFVFWIGQIGVLVGFLFTFLKK
jgi:hypothetical protein